MMQNSTFRLPSELRTRLDRYAKLVQAQSPLAIPVTVSDLVRALIERQLDIVEGADKR